MGCGCSKKKTPAEQLAVQKAAEQRRRILKERLEARRAELQRRK
jgi:hypothetical protein